MKIYFLPILLVSFIVLLGCQDRDQKHIYKPIGKAYEQTVYKIGIHPYLNSQKMFDAYQPILQYLHKQMPQTRFELETSKTYAAYDAKLYQGKFAFSLPNPYQTYNAIEKGYHVIGKMKPDSVFRGIFVARKSAKLKEVRDLKGKVISFPAPTALAATMMPLYYLHEKGVDTEHDITKKFVGSQYSSIMNAYTGDSIAGATWPPPWEAWCKENPDLAKEMELVWQTKPLINNGFIVRNDVDPQLARKLMQVLIDLDKTDEGKALLSHAGFEGFEAADNQTYEVVKTFIEKYQAIKAKE